MKHMLKNERSLTEKKKKSMERDRQSNTFREGRGDWVVLGGGLTEEL